MSTPMRLPKDREAEARKEAGVGISHGERGRRGVIESTERQDTAEPGRLA